MNDNIMDLTLDAYNGLKKNTLIDKVFIKDIKIIDTYESILEVDILLKGTINEITITGEVKI